MQNSHDTTPQIGAGEAPRGSEGGRRPTGEPLGAEVKSLTEVADPEVSSTRRKRVFGSAYKLRILDALDACTAPGQRGALLRREGIYSSCITRWRKQRTTGCLSALNEKRGRRSKSDPKDQIICELEKQNKNLQQRLRQAESIIEIQKKISEMFGVSIDSKNPSERN